ncbi:MAG: Dph6-related ATP pyrophosphatase [Thermoanaerobaculia bacterium]
MRRTILSWSSGKDSAWSLHTLRQSGEHEVVALLTTITRDYDRVSMHAVRRELVEAQADTAGLELWAVEIPAVCTNADYDEAMAVAVRRALDAGIECIAFGDLFLRDIREYREQRLAGSGIAPVFPLWNRPTRELAEEMIAGGLRARLTCIDPRVMPRSLAGADFDRRFLESLPPDVDPCGERGEFHTFAYAGPMFARALPIVTGATVEREGFVFTDVVPGPARTTRDADSSARASSPSK